VKTVWYIDPANSRGTSSNGNDGHTEATALLSSAEAFRRQSMHFGHDDVEFLFLSGDCMEVIMTRPKPDP